jgi:hypothetical protein
MWIDNYIDYASEFCDAPTIFHRFCGYGIVSSIIGRKVWMEKGDRRFYPNLWILILAKSSIQHKSEAIHIAERILESFETVHIMADSGSPEGFLDDLKESDGRTGILFIDEFADFLELLNKDYMRGLKGMLLSFYDGKDKHNRKLKHERIKVKEIFINEFATSTFSWLSKITKDGDIGNGLFPRYLFVSAANKEKTIPFQPKASIEKRNKLLLELNELQTITGEADFSKVKEMYEDWYMHFEDKYKLSGLDGFITRLQDYCLKFAILNEIIMNHSLIISEKAMGLSEELIELVSKELEDNINKIMNIKTVQDAEEKILNIIKKHPQGIKRSAIYTKITLTKKILSESLDTLIDKEKIEFKKIDRTSLIFSKDLI